MGKSLPFFSRRFATHLLSVCCILLFIFAGCMLIIPGKAIAGNSLYLISVCGLFCAMLGLWKWWPSSMPFWPMLALAVIIRIGAVVQIPASDDMNRYIWEGQIQLEGYNPFILAPDAPILKILRNENWEDINHKEISTIYWPFAQQLFKVCAAISPTELFFKTVFTLFDCGIIAILLLLLSRLHVPLNHLLLYALNPLTIFFTAGEGHLEVVMVFWVVLVVYLMICNRFALMYCCLALAVLTKLTPVIFLPFVIKKKNARYLSFFLLPFLLTIPYLQDGASLIKVPLLFFTEFRHNGLLFSLLQTFFDNQQSLMLCGCSMIASCCLIFFLTPYPLKALYRTAAAFLICTPTLHPWYLLLMTPFLVLFRSPAWILLHATILPLAFVFNDTATPSWWHDMPLLLTFEYIPFVCVGIWSFFTSTGHWPAAYPPPNGISVVIPVYNEESTLRGCLNSILSQNYIREIIVVDGGSTDSTHEIVRSCSPAVFITAPRGRGCQIGCGVAAARYDIILILHADSVLGPHTAERIMQQLSNHTDASGGACGAVYDNPSMRFRITELLNNLRAKCTGITFGDQAQFFRRNLLYPAFPSLKLMEDIELSFILKEKGAQIFLSRGVVSSTRGWEKTGYGINFIKVIALSAYYIIRRKTGTLTTDCSDFYTYYYGKK